MTNEIWTLCCVCRRKIKRPGSTEWEDGRVPDEVIIFSHGCCRGCYEDEMERFRSGTSGRKDKEGSDG